MTLTRHGGPESRHSGEGCLLSRAMRGCSCPRMVSCLDSCGCGLGALHVRVEFDAYQTWWSRVQTWWGRLPPVQSLEMMREAAPVLDPCVLTVKSTLCKAHLPYTPCMAHLQYTPCKAHLPYTPVKHTYTGAGRWCTGRWCTGRWSSWVWLGGGAL